MLEHERPEPLERCIAVLAADDEPDGIAGASSVAYVLLHDPIRHLTIATSSRSR